MCSILLLGYKCLHVLVLGLADTFHSLDTTAKKGSVHKGHVIVLGAPVAACCISAPYLDVLVPFVWCTVCYCLEVCFACLPYAVLRSCLAGYSWLDALDTYMGHGLCVVFAVLPSCMLSVLFNIGGIPMHCLDVFVAYVLCSSVRCSVLGGGWPYMYSVLLISSLDVVIDYSLSSCVGASLPAVARLLVYKRKTLCHTDNTKHLHNVYCKP